MLPGANLKFVSYGFNVYSLIKSVEKIPVLEISIAGSIVNSLEGSLFFLNKLIIWTDGGHPPPPTACGKFHENNNFFLNPSLSKNVGESKEGSKQNCS